MEQYFLLGVIPQRLTPPSGVYGDGWLIAFVAENQKVALLEGPSAHYHSPVKDLGLWFQFQPKYVMSEGGKNSLVVEKPRWFEHKLQEAGCSWFLPLAARIVAGEKIPLPEITAAYAANNQGHQIVHGSIADLFDHAKKKGLLK